MRYRSLDAFLTDGRAALAKGPVALIFVEDLVEVASTIRYHRELGFARLILFAPAALDLGPESEPRLDRVDYDVTAPGGLERAVNAVIEAAPGFRKLRPASMTAPSTTAQAPARTSIIVPKRV